MKETIASMQKSREETVTEEAMSYEYWFAAIPSLSDQKKRILRTEFDSAGEIYYIEETKLLSENSLVQKDVRAIMNSKLNWNIKKEYEKLRAQNIRLITWHSSVYPNRLKQITPAPYALYVKGGVPKDELPSVAIVGARMCSTYGEKMAREFAAILANEGVQIISGLARGVDGIGQRSAIHAGGYSYGVLGCGVDICYPREHIGLYMDLQKHGGVLSEYIPGEPPLARHFPARNRIISGLSDVVLVMEAKEASGSLITADMALEQGKDVYALPGPVHSSLSRGCNRLIRQGAGILLSPEELLQDLCIISKKISKNIPENKIMLENTENLVYSCLDLFPKNLNQLTEEVRLPVQDLTEALITLELRGYIEEISKNYYVKKA